MSVKKIFERNVKNSRLGGVGCVERHPREFSGVRRFEQVHLWLRFGKTNKFALLSTCT